MAVHFLIDYLTRMDVIYSLHSHSVAYTAQEAAENSHVHGRNFAKVVMVKIDSELSMVVLPAHYHVNLTVLRDLLAVNSVELAVEREFSHRFPRCEVGAMPPIGHLFGVMAYMMPVFAEDEEIVFNAGVHSEVVRMSYRDFLRIAHVTEIAEGIVPPVLHHSCRARLRC